MAFILVWMFFSSTDPSGSVDEPLLNMEVASEISDTALVVAKVGSAVLTVDEYLTMSNSYQTFQETQNPLEIIEGWIEQEIVSQEAERMGLAEVDSVKDALKQLVLLYELNRKQILVEAWANEITNQIELPKREVKNYFKDHADEFLYDVKVSQIVVTDPSTADLIYEQLTHGADFTKLAEEYSLDQLKGQPSDFIGRGSGMLTLPIEETIFSLETGKFSEPVMTEDGVYFIFKLQEKVRVHKEVNFEEVEDYIESSLIYERSQEVMEQKLEAMRKNAREDIDIYLENLLFHPEETR